MLSRRKSRGEAGETWRRATIAATTLLVFGFVTMMVLLGQDLIAATAAAGATGITAVNLANRLASVEERATVRTEASPSAADGEVVRE